MFIRYAAFHLQQLSAKRQRESAELKSIESGKETKETETEVKEVVKETETKETKRDKKSQEKEAKEKKKEAKKEKESAKKEESKKEEEKEVKVEKTKEDDLLLNENYSEIDTDVAKKIVESITDSICSGSDKQETDCECYIFTIYKPNFNLFLMRSSFCMMFNCFSLKFCFNFDKYI